jgi:FixJ family two-component response regulator
MADLEMHELAGEEMARRGRAARPDLKVLYVSGVIDRLLNERPTLWEGEAFLEKPFTAAGLREAVALLLFGTLSKL